MKNIDLIELGFKKEHVSIEESGGNAFDYYTYDIGDECFLISSASDECIDEDYYVEVFNKHGLGKTYDKDIVKEFIDVLNKFKIN